MDQADSVHSTPPTNTSLSQNFLVDPTRRHLITVAAGGAVAAAIPTAVLSAAPADPIYAAIDRHRDLAKACDAAWKLRSKCKDFGTLTEEEEARVRELNDLTDAAHLPLEAAAVDLCNTHPTTRTGISTALFYMRIQHRNDGEHMIRGWLEDEDGERYIDWRDAWLETIIQAVMQLDDTAVRS
jgi:hypothetical protein